VKSCAADKESSGNIRSRINVARVPAAPLSGRISALSFGFAWAPFLAAEHDAAAERLRLTVR
jgi:hypothetical protein